MAHRTSKKECGTGRGEGGGVDGKKREGKDAAEGTLKSPSRPEGAKVDGFANPSARPSAEVR